VLSIPQLAKIRDIDPYLHETLVRIVAEVNGIATSTGASGTPLAAPPEIAQVKASASGGLLSVTITDPAGAAQANLGLHYFVEWDTKPSFPNPTVEDIGPARGEQIFIGNQTVYVRAYSQFRNSPISPKVTYGGSKAIAVAGGGTVTPPAPPGGGSGSGSGGGGGGGFGDNNNGRNLANTEQPAF
jgi:hypothetical protein